RTGLNVAIKMYKPEKVSVIAHSFGSFVVAQLLRSEINVPWHRIVFCGSVNNQDFPLDQLLDRFTTPIMNEIGGGDYLPALAERATWSYGSVGSHGFLSSAVYERFHRRIGHSGFLRRDFCEKYWIPFLRDGLLEKGDEWEDFPFVIRLLLRVPWRWIILAAVVALSILGGSYAAKWAWGRETPYNYVQTASDARPYTDLGAAISAMVSDIEANCRRGWMDRWWRGQKCLMVQASSGITALRVCRNLDFRASTPEGALQLVADRFPGCVSFKNEAGSLSVAVRERATIEWRDRRGVWLLCACSVEQIRALE